MKKSITLGLPYLPYVSSFSLILCLSVQAGEPLPLSKSYWKDESFLKSFNASYRINSRIEPNVSTTERGALVSIQSLMADGKRKEALQKLKSSSSFSSSAALLFNAGNIEFELGNTSEAQAHYQQSLALFPNFRRAHKNLGFLYAKEGDWEKALLSLEESIELGDQDGATYGQLAYGRMAQQQYSSALQAYRLAQVTQPDNLDWKAGIAQCLQHVARHEEAIVLLDEVIMARPTEAAYYLLQASIQLDVGDQESALVNLDLVRRMSADQLSGDNYLLLAQLHMRSGSAVLAEPLLTKSFLATKKPSLERSLDTLKLITETADWKLARSFSDQISNAFPQVSDEKLSPEKKRLSALIDIASGANPSRGAEVLDGLISEDPLDAAAMIILARHRVSEGRFDESEMLLQQAARVDDSTYEAKVALAKLYVSQKRYEEALSQLDSAIKLQRTESMIEYRTAVSRLAETQR
ncbi:tetratricopeptide repeat protein [Akkermansiaceae bacterium]|nr:tetratricopeptide repeat protein [Akkermansiaceae bacterium]